MNKKKRNRIIGNVVAIVIIVVAFLIINRRIEQGYRQRFSLSADDAHYCYGIDSLEREGDLLKLKGWFFELKSVQKKPQDVRSENGELLLGLIPLDEAIVNTKVEDAIVMNIERKHEDRPDVNEYFLCEYDYSKCGFTATIDCNDIDLESNSYRIAIKADVGMSSESVLTNVYLTENGISYTDPRQSPKLDTEGTDIDRIVKDGVRLSSRPDFDCYVYQLGDKLYWIADNSYAFNDNGATYIQYQMNTTQFDKLPQERIENNWFFSNIGDYFESHEITNEINCGKYRVSVRDIPKEYSVVDIETGYFTGEWVWHELFKPNYAMLFGSIE